MPEPEEGEVRPLPIDPQVVAQQAQSTIKGIVDAVVELVTNSDDSYRRIESAGGLPSGLIRVEIIREKGGKCRLLEVTDEAEGMDWPALERAATFAASASGFYEGRSVRGLFGRGMKEAIVGLGSGEIRTVKDGRESAVEIFVENRQTKYRILKKERASVSPNGTTVVVEVTSPRARCQKFDIIYRQLSSHFALREILENPGREVILFVDDNSMKRTRRLQFASPAGQERVNKELSVEGFGGFQILVYESPDKLEFNQGDPSSVAGILVKSEGAVLDSRLFGFEADEAAHYFFGVLDCPGIAATIRAGDLGVLDPGRSGLDWRHQYARALQEEVRRILRPLIDEKRKRLEESFRRPVSERHKRKLIDVCRLLNSIVAEELEDLPAWGEPDARLETLTVRPQVAYAEPNVPRPFTVYVPEDLLGISDDPVDVIIVAAKGNVSLVSDSVDLAPYPKCDGIRYGHFSAVGRSYGDQASIMVSLNGQSDTAQLIVKPASHKPRGDVVGPGRGLFKEIDFDTTADPMQRVSFSEGIIKVYVRFPPISDYLEAGGEGMDTPQGSLVLAELVAEAFCREVARRRIESIDPPPTGGGAEIDHFNNRVNQLMSKYLARIHHALVVR